MLFRREFLKLLICCVFLTKPHFSVAGNVPSLELGELTARVDKGRDEISKLQQRAMLPRGTCWKSALEDLSVSCKGMIPEHQSRLAFKFTTCYNEMVGFPSVICERNMAIPDCMKSLDVSSQGTFREFFLHTQDMCYFLEHQLWQEKTSNAVNEVTNAVTDVTKNLEEAKETQEKVLLSQQESLKVQSNIIKDNSEIYSMVLNVKDVFEDVQASAVEQRQVVVEVFDKLTRMQKLVSWIQGEMSLLDMMGFYFACVLFGFFGTSSRRTQSARFWIVLLCIVVLGLERCLFNHLNSLDSYSPEMIQESIWILRRSAAVFGVIILVCAAAFYRDPQMVQQNMLTMVNKRLDRLTTQMDDMQGFMKNNSIMSLEGGGGLPTNEEEVLDDSDSDTYSNYSGDSDMSNFDQPEAMHWSQSLATLEEGESESDSNDENRIPETDARTTNNLFAAIKNRFSSNTNRETSLDRSITNESKHSYNLRTRVSSGPSSPNIIHESATEFAQIMKHPNRYMRRSSAANYYSSDEDV
ncbi:uncharacterized protein LOC110858256 [Folsomia candida]|uniref:Protein GAMETE EXPRESSED 1 n=1 Tax=Folsomia candida TaxID=158441 RepID=A0A226DH09_FOLCA|nr:uncharacterized protein LOC110858256 [Folsomia candida]OXA43891.1 Protein GAMETE EXPRESSED 1 [Folsomia candida]